MSCGSWLWLMVRCIRYVCICVEYIFFRCDGFEVSDERIISNIHWILIGGCRIIMLLLWCNLLYTSPRLPQIFLSHLNTGDGSRAMVLLFALLINFNFQAFAFSFCFFFCKKAKKTRVCVTFVQMTSKWLSPLSTTRRVTSTMSKVGTIGKA